MSIAAWIFFAALAAPAMQGVRALAHLNEAVLQFWAVLPAEHGKLLRWAANPVVILTAIGLTWHAMVEHMCFALPGRVLKNAWAIGRDMTIFGIAIFTTGWLYNHPEHIPVFLTVLPWAIGAILIWKWAAAARAFVRARQGAFYSQPQYRLLLGLWIGLTAGVAASAWLAGAANEMPAPIVVFLAVWVLPGGELAACAVNLAQNRHR